MWRDSVLAGGGARGPPGRIRRKLVGSNQYEAVQAGNETVLAASIHDVSEWLMSGGSGHHLEEQPIVITILCWLLVLLTTVFSTGLLVLEPTVIVREGISIPIQSTFDAQGYQIPQLGPAAAQLYHAINFQGLPYPIGTSADIVRIPTSMATVLLSRCTNYFCVSVSVHSGTLTSRSVHPASPVLLTKMAH
ncbi:hypothetical protein HYQ44_010162 [Verticillium longisporum]|nr:hypothetical protein HYQ44_010162 [Verticillium longisporum]